MIFITCNLFSQGYWTQKADFPIAGRQHAPSFSIGSKGYVIFGNSTSFLNSDDLVEYDQATDTWTQKADFPGSDRLFGQVFAINDKAYVCSGAEWTSYGTYIGFNDVWRYNPANDNWVQLGNFPGTARHGGFSFAYDGKGYVGMGMDENNNYLNDMWEYNPSTDTWTQKASFPGTPRKSGFNFAIGKYGFIGLGYYGSSLTQIMDVWQFDAPANTWIQKNNFPYAGRCWLGSFAIGNKGYIVDGYLIAAQVNTTQFYEYDPNNDTWTQLEDYTGDARRAGSGFAINGKAYYGTGNASSNWYLDFYEYTPGTVGVDNLADNIFGLKIHPNPAINRLSVSYRNSIGLFSVQIFNSIGQPVLTSFNSENIDISALPEGLYLVKLFNSANEILGQKSFIKTGK